jgi:heme-degrading monooxygenase HmoA
MADSLNLQESILPGQLKAEAAPSTHCPFHQTVQLTDSAVSPIANERPSTVFVALSKFVIANDKAAEVKEAFRRRPHLVDNQPGFMRLEVFSPLANPQEIWLMTYWTDAESFTLWHRSHLYQQAHKGIPKELKLMPGETEIRYFEHICS